MNKLVTIVIVNYNSFDLLEKCLNSISEFVDEKMYRIILIDNNSDGDVSKISKKFRCIELIRNEKNIGFAAANNKAIKIIDTKYTLLINNDIIFEEDSIKKIIDIAEKNDEEIIVGCRLLNPDGSIQESAYQFPNIWNTFTENFFLSTLFKKNKVFSKSSLSFSHSQNFQRTDSVKGAFMFCSSQQLKKIGGFDERFFFYSEDIDLCKRFKEAGGKIYFYPGTSVIHYEISNNKKDFWFYHKNLSIGKIQYYQKHFLGLRLIFVLIIHFCGIAIRVPLYAILYLIKFDSAWLKKSLIYIKLLFVYRNTSFRNLG